MKNAPNLWSLKSLMKACDDSIQVGLPDGSYVPARPFGFYGLSNRLSLAWMVFTGKADAFVWPGDQ